MTCKVIKKYKNRRLYDTESSRHITFDALKTLIHERVDFQVVDSSTGQDITSATLLQILVESQQNQSQMVPKALLLNLIRISEHPMYEHLNQLLAQSMQFYQQPPSVDAMQTVVSQLNQHNQMLFKQWQQLFQVTTPSPEENKPPKE